MSGKQYLFAVQVRQRHVCGESLFRMYQNVCRSRFRVDSLQQFTKRHSVPAVVKTAPASHAMEITESLDSGQGAEILPAQGLRRVHPSVDPKIPSLRIKPGDRSVVQDRPLEGQRLPRRQ